MKIIKKYRNRRLYDTDLKKSITVNEVKDYVMNDIEFTIIDNTTQKDITVSVLATIISQSSYDFKNSGLKTINAILKRGGVNIMDIFKKLTLASIGAVNITRDKLEEIFNEMVKKGEMTDDEKSEAIKNFVDKSIESTSKTKEKIEGIVESVIEKVSSKINKQVSNLSEKVEELSQKVEGLEKKIK